MKIIVLIISRNLFRSQTFLDLHFHQQFNFHLPRNRHLNHRHRKRKNLIDLTVMSVRSSCLETTSLFNISKMIILPPNVATLVLFAINKLASTDRTPVTLRATRRKDFLVTSAIEIFHRKSLSLNIWTHTATTRNCSSASNVVSSSNKILLSSNIGSKNIQWLFRLVRSVTRVLWTAKPSSNTCEVNTTQQKTSHALIAQKRSLLGQL